MGEYKDPRPGRGRQGQVDQDGGMHAMVVDGDRADDDYEGDDQEEMRLLSGLFSVFRHLHDLKNGLDDEAEEEQQQQLRRAPGRRAPRQEEYQLVRLRQGVREASREILKLTSDWEFFREEDDEGRQEVRALVRQISLMWELLELFFLKGTVEGMLPPLPTVKWLQHLAGEEPGLEGWDRVMDLVLQGKTTEALEELRRGRFDGEALMQPVIDHLRNDPWAAAMMRAQRAEEEGYQEEAETQGALRRRLLSDWSTWHSKGLSLVKAVKAKGGLPLKVQHLLEVLAGDTGIAATMVHQQGQPQWAKLLLCRILYTAPEVHLHRSNFNDHRSKCQRALEGLEATDGGGRHDAGEDLLEQVITLVSQGQVGAVLEAMWGHHGDHLVTMSFLTFLSDLLCVAWRTKGMLDDLKCYTDIQSQDQIRSKALIYLARKLQDMGPMRRVQVPQGPGEVLGKGQWRKMALWQVSFQLIKVVAVEVQEWEGVDCLAELVRALGEENLREDEVEWLREECTDVLGSNEILQAWADMCRTAGDRALQEDNIQRGVYFLLHSAWTLSRIVPDKRVDMPLGPVGGPLQSLREEASELCNRFLDGLCKALQPQHGAQPGTLIRTAKARVEEFIKAIKDFEANVPGGSSLTCHCPELSLLEDLDETLLEFLGDGVGRAEQGTHRLVSILTKRPDPTSIQRFWGRILRVLLAFLLMIRQEGSSSHFTSNEAMVALQCLETLETSHRRDEYLGGLMTEQELRQLRYELAQMIAKAFRGSTSKGSAANLEGRKRGQQLAPSSPTTVGEEGKGERWSFWSPVDDLMAPRIS